MTPPSSIASPPRLHTGRPEREPPRNEDGQMVCDHADCAGQVIRFRRLCEYNKHMDRHERPYHCTNLACEQNPGFTYSGGLLRHQREVHKMYLAKGPLYCPHLNCVRSSGTGFTRKENLEEHLRRRHSTLVGEITPPIDSLRIPQMAPLSSSRKRIRQTSCDGDSGLGNNQDIPRMDEISVDAATIIKRMQIDVAQRDHLIQQLKQEVDQLRQLLASLPQSLYQTAQVATHPG